VFDLPAQQDLHRGFSDALARAIELVLTPIVFAGVGWLIDRVAGTSPWGMVTLFAFALVGTAVKLKLGYDRDMAAHDGSVATTPRRIAPVARTKEQER
jgi:F0F1-type ATP synthase assembly protein I